MVRFLWRCGWLVLEVSSLEWFWLGCIVDDLREEMYLLLFMNECWVCDLLIDELCFCFWGGGVLLCFDFICLGMGGEECMVVGRGEYRLLLWRLFFLSLLCLLLMVIRLEVGMVVLDESFGKWFVGVSCCDDGIGGNCGRELGVMGSWGGKIGLWNWGICGWEGLRCVDMIGIFLVDGVVVFFEGFFFMNKCFVFGLIV